MEEVDKSFAIFLFNTGVAVKKKCHERPLEFLKFFQVNKSYMLLNFYHLVTVDGTKNLPTHTWFILAANHKNSFKNLGVTIAIYFPTLIEHFHYAILYSLQSRCGERVISKC